MAMEIGFGATKWSSTSIAPFGPAPGAGRLGALNEGLQRRPRQVATTEYESGFAADPVGNEASNISTAYSPITVTKRAVNQGEVPSALFQIIYTDRGILTQMTLDQMAQRILGGAGFTLSRASTFAPQMVTWQWQRYSPQDDFYLAVIASPAALAGIRYGGGAIPSGTGTPVYNPTPVELAKLPSQVYVYTAVATSKQQTMTDADGAKLITQLKQIISETQNKAQAFSNVRVTLMGVPPDVFPSSSTPVATASVVPGAKAGPVALGVSALAIIIATQIFSTHAKVHLVKTMVRKPRWT